MAARSEVSKASSDGSPNTKVDVIVTTASPGAAVAAVKVALERAIAPSATTAFSPDHAPVDPNVDAVSWIQPDSSAMTGRPCSRTVVLVYSSSPTTSVIVAS